MASRNLILLVILTLISCKPESREIVQINQLPIQELEALQRTDKVGAPIVLHHDQEIEILHILRNSNFELEKYSMSKSLSEDITIDVFSNEIFQFKVPIQKNHLIPDWHYQGVDTIAAISDIEGNYPAFVSWLKGNEIIDKDFNWTFGPNHLVINGDVMDRGADVFSILWLIYKLEPEAIQSGGRVHLVLGNHEQLNLQGIFDKSNLKYVHTQYFNDASVLGLPYEQWISNKSEIGKWLRTKNSIIQIDQNIFVHGGISPELSNTNWSIQNINDINRGSLQISSKKYNKDQTLIALSKGPLWYRGLADQEIESEQLNDFLDDYNAERFIIGHTIVHEDRIEPLYEGRVIPIDLHLEKTFKKGIAKGIFITNDGLYEVDNKKNSTAIDQIAL